MARLKAVVLTASIDDDEAVRRWVSAVQEQARTVQDAIDALSSLLAESPHVVITLHQGEAP